MIYIIFSIKQCCSVSWERGCCSRERWWG